jgi:hypothetical protein
MTCVFHNLKGFDSKYLLSGMAKLGVKNISVIAKSTEKFLSITAENVKYIDSYALLPFSLDSLTEGLRKDGLEKFKVTRRIFRQLSDDRHCRQTSVPLRLYH